MNIYEQEAPLAGEADTHTFLSLDEFNEYKESCEHLIEQSQAAAKLSEDPNFKKIIMEDYFVNEPRRLGELLASGRLTPSGFDGAVDDLRSIGHLRSYLSGFIEKGNIAVEELEQLKAAREAAIEEQNAGGIV